MQVLQDRQLDAAVLGQPHHVYWASAHRAFWLHESAFILFSDGRSCLASANAPLRDMAADEAVSFEATSFGTQRQDQPVAAANLIIETLRHYRAKHIGIDASAITSQLAIALNGQCSAIDSDLWQLRRRKHPDELSLMKHAIRCTEAMHRRAREMIEPGIPELRVFTELNAAAVHTAGEPLTALLGNDYACGSGGGPSRKDVVAQAGQIYILDLGPAYRGYFSDNARAYSVGRKPTDVQLKTWQAITGVFPIVERMARPGVRCRDIYDTVQSYLMEHIGVQIPHHLGHGVGLQPHEYPHLNPSWDDTLIEGEIFTVEPGLYSPEINGGMRIENQYLVIKDGVENLVNVPMGLC